ncbi:conserved hypothetical protein [Borreliella finlandensis]|uniref:Glycoprotease family protein n=1 Tax=Borreliella finlandensis TaxID=498741 RepID=A0A826GRN2_9SPIR|nr:conserved hypothetical protein [Borreliella finlandensis]
MVNTLAFEYSYKALIVYCRINNNNFSLVELKSNLNFSVPKIFNDFVIKNNIDLNQIELIINSCGPGSFTGIRISLSLSRSCFRSFYSLCQYFHIRCFCEFS